VLSLPSSSSEEKKEKREKFKRDVCLSMLKADNEGERGNKPVDPSHLWTPRDGQGGGEKENKKRTLRHLLRGPGQLGGKKGGPPARSSSLSSACTRRRSDNRAGPEEKGKRTPLTAMSQGRKRDEGPRS